MIKEYTIKSNSKNDEDYDVRLVFDDNLVLIPEKCSCECKKGSFYRFTKKNISMGKWQCRHITEALQKYKNGEKDIIEIEKKELQNIIKKPLNPIFKDLNSQNREV
jgi:predicted nucleic acid-binding Zn finger protein